MGTRKRNFANNISTSGNLVALDATKLTGTIADDRIPSPTLTIKGDGASAVGKVKINCEQNTHGITIQSPAHSSGATYTLTLPTTDGNASEFLQTNGSGVTSWAAVTPGGVNTPAFYAYISSSTTSLSSGVLTKVPYNTEVYDVGACFDTGNNRFVVPAGEGGKYIFWGNIRFADGLTSKELSFVPYLNGSGFGWNQLHTPSYSSGWHTVWGTFTKALNATDYVELYARHNKGSNHNIGGGNELNCNFGGFKIIE